MKQETRGDPLLPEGISHIPAFSVCEICLASKNETTSLTGSSVKITTVRIAPFSLHSVTPDLQFFASSLGAARADQLLFRENLPCLTKDLEVKVRSSICVLSLFC